MYILLLSKGSVPSAAQQDSYKSFFQSPRGLDLGVDGSRCRGVVPGRIIADPGRDIAARLPGVAIRLLYEQKSVRTDIT
jgi:hypothetical protein